LLGSRFITRGWRHQYSTRHIRSPGLFVLKRWLYRHVVCFAEHAWSHCLGLPLLAGSLQRCSVAGPRLVCHSSHGPHMPAVAIQLDCPRKVRSLGTSIHHFAGGLALMTSMYELARSIRRLHHTNSFHFEGCILLAVPVNLRCHLARSAASHESTYWLGPPTWALDQHAPDPAVPVLHNVTHKTDVMHWMFAVVPFVGAAPRR